jgi:hypothetical protein
LSDWSRFPYLSPGSVVIRFVVGGRLFFLHNSKDESVEEGMAIVPRVE